MKRQTKKYTLVTFFFILGFLATSAQSWMWSEPQAITDSMADNRNATVVELLLHDEWGHYIFWERTIDENSTAIYYRNLYTADAPQAIHEMTGVHYRNPRFIVTHPLYNEDTLCFFFYETDEGGNSDIYYQVLTPDGFSESVPLAATIEDESHFRCNDCGTMTWQEGDKIKYALMNVGWQQPLTISEPATLDSINCHSPDVPYAYIYYNWTTIAWLKNTPEDTAIWFSYYDWQTSTYAQPELLADESGTITNMRFDADACYGATDVGEFLSWENVEEGLHTIQLKNMWFGDFTSNFQQTSDFTPKFSGHITPVDDEYFHGYLTFIDGSTGNGDIRVNEEEWEIPTSLDGYYNLSDSPDEESNPDFFNGRCELYFCDLVLTWESLRDGHWQIYYSTANLMCFGGSTENQLNKIDLQVYPNPARDKCTISYKLQDDSFVSLQLTTLDGRQVRLVDPEFQSQGEHQYHLDLEQVFSGFSVCGMFMVSLETEGGLVTRKVLRVE